MTSDELLLFIALPLLVALIAIVTVAKLGSRKELPLETDDSDDVEDIISLLSEEGDEAIEVPSTAVTGDLSVRFDSSGKVYPWNPQTPSLLLFAEGHGIDVDSYCREGHCATCQTQLISGEVEYTQAPRVKVDPGHCLLCISMPKTDLVLAL
jgi:ferredoxin